MTNKSGAIGTRTETAIVRHARANGFAGADEMTQAQRLRLNGAQDQGDIGLCPGVMIQSKGGAAAEQASDALIAQWLAETEAERVVRGCPVAFLVTKRKGKGYGNAGAWWAHMSGRMYVLLAGISTAEPIPDWLPAARMTVADALGMLRGAGYGDRVEPECPLPVPQRHGERRNTLGGCAAAMPELGPDGEPCPYATAGGALYLDNLRRLGPSPRTIEAAEAVCTCGKHKLESEMHAANSTELSANVGE